MDQRLEPREQRLGELKKKFLEYLTLFRTMFSHWLEYNEGAATDATRRMREFLKRHLN